MSTPLRAVGPVSTNDDGGVVVATFAGTDVRCQPGDDALHLWATVSAPSSKVSAHRDALESVAATAIALATVESIAGGVVVSMWIDPSPDPLAFSRAVRDVHLLVRGVAEVLGVERAAVAGVSDVSDITGGGDGAAVEPEPLPAAVELDPEPFAADPDPDPEPEPEPDPLDEILTEPAPVQARPAPFAAEPETVLVDPEPEPEPAAAEPEPTAAEPTWGYVLAPTEVRGLVDSSAVVGQLVPGTWYELLDVANGWRHVRAHDGTMEGWAAATEVHEREA